MKKLWMLALTAALAGCLESPSQPEAPNLAVSTAPGQNKLTCFADGLATCTLNNSGAKGSATLTVTGATGTGAAAVYYVGYNESLYGVQLGGIKDLSFQYTGTATAGAPRFSIPIDENDDGLTEAFAFVGASTCNNGQGKVDAIGDNTCTVVYGAETFANWAAFAAAHPTYEVALLDNYAFVIADETGSWTVNQVAIGKTGK